MTRTFIVFAATVTFTAILSGCASFTSPGRYHALENDKPYWFDYGSERRGALLVPQKHGGTLMCSEPVPRVTATLDAEGKGKASAQPANLSSSASAEAEGKVKSGASTINEEVMVLFLREALYRLCEMSVNLGSVEKEYKEPVLKLYTNVIDAAVNLSGKTDQTQRDQIRARTLEKYIDLLAQYQKNSSDAALASSQATKELKAQIDGLKETLGQSVKGLQSELAALKTAPDPAPSGVKPAQ
ncbi:MULTISPECIES: hypothetical protein [unclassified Polaromonas]|uniref:hypothetical protein n=1 Tax=unclassified Polaromonas TaxID=2638319 RepID=UPI000F07EB72|nr:MULTISPECIES: hypothetical protein [unclassified Polaromonas]AYQ27809.1 hypothetical protein DT070_07125 [Polaromonas sp. SP1]QGJ17332.1 hypothetical protein F7R28_02295 [Polaromonas sp. Pch-P]